MNLGPTELVRKACGTGLLGDLDGTEDSVGLSLWRQQLCSPGGRGAQTHPPQAGPPLRHTPGLPVMLLGSRQGEREDQLPGSPSSDPQAQGLGSKPWMAEP